jgi:hypothetical protein
MNDIGCRIRRINKEKAGIYWKGKAGTHILFGFGDIPEIIWWRSLRSDLSLSSDENDGVQEQKQGPKAQSPAPPCCSYKRKATSLNTGT